MPTTRNNANARRVDETAADLTAPTSGSVRRAAFTGSLFLLVACGSTACAPLATRAEFALDDGNLERAANLLERESLHDEPEADLLRLRLSEAREEHLATLALADELFARDRLTPAQIGPFARDAAAALDDVASWATWWVRTSDTLAVQQHEATAGMLAFRTHLRAHEQTIPLVGQLLALELDEASRQALANFVELNIYRLIYEREFEQADALITSLARRLQSVFVEQKLRAALLLQQRSDAGMAELNELAGTNESLLEAIAFDYGARGLYLASARVWNRLAELRNSGAGAAYAYRTAAESFYRADNSTAARLAVQSALTAADRPALALGDLVRIMHEAEDSALLQESIAAWEPPTPCEPVDVAEWIMLENAIAAAGPSLTDSPADLAGQRYENLFRACAVPDVTDAAMATFLQMNDGERALEWGLRGFDEFGGTARRLTLLVASASRAGDTGALVGRIRNWFDSGPDPQVMNVGDVIEALDTSTEPAFIELRGELLGWAMTQGTPPLPLALRRATVLEQADRVGERRDLMERVIATADDRLNVLAQFGEWMAAQNVDPVERFEFLQRIVDEPGSESRDGLRGPSGGANMRQRALWLQILAAHDQGDGNAVFESMSRWVDDAGPDDPDVWQTLWTQRRALTLLSPEARIELGRRSIAGGYGGVEIHRAVAESLLVLGRTGEAAAAYEMAVENEPGIAAALVESLAEDGRPDIAVRVMERYRQIRGDTIPVLIQTADLYSELAEASRDHRRAMFERMARAIYAELATMPGAWTRVDPYRLAEAGHVDLAAQIGLGRYQTTDERDPTFTLSLATWLAQSGGDEATIRSLAESSLDKAARSSQSRAISALARSGYQDIAADLDERLFIVGLDTSLDLNWLGRTLDSAITTGDLERARRVIRAYTVDLAQALISSAPDVPRAVINAGSPDTTAARLLNFGAHRLMEIGDFDAANAAAEMGLQLRVTTSAGLLGLALRSRAAQVMHPLDQAVVDNYVFLSGLSSQGWLIAARQLGADARFDLSFYAFDRYFSLSTEPSEGLAALSEVATRAGRADLLEARWAELLEDAPIASLLDMIRSWRLPMLEYGMSDLWGDFVLTTEPWVGSSEECARRVTDELIRRGEVDRARTLALRNDTLDALALEQLYLIGLQDEALLRLQQRRNLSDPVEREVQLASLEAHALPDMGAQNWEAALRSARNDGSRPDVIGLWRMQQWSARRGRLRELAALLTADNPGNSMDAAFDLFSVALMVGDETTAQRILQDVADGRGDNASYEPMIDPGLTVVATLAAADLVTLRRLAENLDPGDRALHHQILLAWTDLLDGHLMDLFDRMNTVIMPAALAEQRLDLVERESATIAPAVIALLKTIASNGLRAEATDWTRTIAESNGAVDVFDIALVEMLIPIDGEQAAALSDRLMQAAGNDPELGVQLLDILSESPAARLGERPWLNGPLFEYPGTALRALESTRWTSASESLDAWDSARAQVDDRQREAASQLEIAQSLSIAGRIDELRQLLNNIPRQTLTGAEWTEVVGLYATNGMPEVAIRELHRMEDMDETRLAGLRQLLRRLPTDLFPEVGAEVEAALLRRAPNGWTLASETMRVSIGMGLSDAGHRVQEAMGHVLEPNHRARLIGLLQFMQPYVDELVNDSIWASIAAAAERVRSTDDPMLELLLATMQNEVDPAGTADRLRSIELPGPSLAYLAADTFVRLNEFDLATSTASAALDLNPAAIPPRQILALVALRTGDLPGAMLHTRAIITDGALMADLLPEILAELAEGQHQAEAFEVALALGRVVSLEPGDEALPQHVGLDIALGVFEENNPEMGIRFVELSGIPSLEFSGVSLRVASLYAAGGHLDEASSMLSRVHWNRALVLNNLAYHLAEFDGDAALSEDYARQSLSLRSNDPNTMDTLAWALHQQGRDVEALQLIQQALWGALADPRTSYEGLRVVYQHLVEIQASLPAPEPEPENRRRRNRRRNRQ
jgi:hypothetical protein